MREQFSRAFYFFTHANESISDPTWKVSTQENSPTYKQPKRVATPYIFLVNKSHEKTKTNNELIKLSSIARKHDILRFIPFLDY